MNDETDLTPHTTHKSLHAKPGNKHTPSLAMHIIHTTPRLSNPKP